MFRTLLAALLCSATWAVAAEVSATYEVEGHGTVVVTLTDTPCVDEAILANVKPEYHAQLLAGRATVAGTPRGLCWSGEASPGEVFVIDAQGSYGLIPMTLFKAVGTGI